MSLKYRIAEAKVYIEEREESIGKGIFAVHGLKAGEEVLTLERPLVGSLESYHLPNACTNCYIWTEGSATGSRLYVDETIKVQKCAGCQRFRYCSKSCQREAWNRGHKHECKILRPVVGREIPKAVLACIELLSRRKHGLIPDDTWNVLLGLQSHVQEMKANGMYGNIELMALGASQISMTQNMFDRDFVAAMYAKILTNSLTLITPTLDPLGIVLDPILGNINHSCDPNAFVMMNGSQISVRMLKPIKNNEEVLISYIDTTHSYSKRQQDLRSRWFFTCHCSKCGHGVSQDADHSLDAIKNAPDEEIDSEVHEEIFERYESAQSLPPDEALVVIREAMQTCRDTNTWPLHRQPYASLRDDLIINLISTEQFSDAWAHCAMRYKHISPKLYPVPFHPVRVVQTWQMAMLAANLASTPEGISAPGVNIGLIAMMLVKQTLDVVQRSHGEDSDFAKSVRRKAEEMTAELRRSLGGQVDSAIMNKELEVQRDMLVKMGDWAEF